ncbi:hypothetical protein HUN08_04475 [Gordonia sp. X0973]|uniref:hypothetical protein n=1 Tax=Gordonia sp. X0973 TaxID=2742602 RepID=UPI000F53BB9D|nr:hypothetical protein [Gordonia sp. X0973]QKT06526.1 hypothetical protein HUN08_04475 [Gordonia sp. X0973]
MILTASDFPSGYRAAAVVDPFLSLRQRLTAETTDPSAPQECHDAVVRGTQTMLTFPQSAMVFYRPEVDTLERYNQRVFHDPESLATFKSIVGFCQGVRTWTTGPMAGTAEWPVDEGSIKPAGLPADIPVTITSWINRSSSGSMGYRIVGFAQVGEVGVQLEVTSATTLQRIDPNLFSRLFVEAVNKVERGSR